MIQNILIFGGGRWARIIIDVILELLPNSSIVFIYTPHNSEFMKNWISTNKFKDRLQVILDLGTIQSKNISFAIVVNKASDHEKVIEWSIHSGIPCLVEKPFTIDSNSSHRVIELAKTQNVLLAGALVFRFARSIENFKVHLDREIIKTITIFWEDAKVEVRHGEKKSFDPTLPLHRDVLPHIFSILVTLNLPLPKKLTNINISQDKNRMNLSFYLEKILCRVELIREGDSRKRRIEVETESGIKFLDFSKDPGFIFNGAQEINADPKWDIDKRPLATMLDTFLNSIKIGILDKRLDPSLGLAANEFIDSNI